MITPTDLTDELSDCYDKCQELFDIAWKLNDDDNTRNMFTLKTTSYMSDVMQTLGYCRHLAYLLAKNNIKA